jgi:hypothetical protein
MAAWTAHTAIGAGRDQVMDVLTRPCSIAAWAPMPFEVEGLRGDRLETGSHARVAGRLAGKELEFDVSVHQATADMLRLTASGPFVELDVAYDINALDEWSQLTASIGVTGKGVLGRFVAKAVEGLLASGGLDHALARLAKTVETGHDLEYQTTALAA